jgi:hypothetical protein
MAITLHANKGWVETDGSYGFGDVITFDEDDLTQDQWDVLERLSDTDRIEYVQAIMAGEPLDDYETEA